MVIRPRNPWKASPGGLAVKTTEREGIRPPRWMIPWGPLASRAVGVLGALAPQKVPDDQLVEGVVITFPHQVCDRFLVQGPNFLNEKLEGLL